MKELFSKFIRKKVGVAAGRYVKKGASRCGEGTCVFFKEFISKKVRVAAGARLAAAGRNV